MRAILLGATFTLGCMSARDTDFVPPTDSGPSHARHTKTFTPTYDRSVTAGNPLKGFLSSPQWGNPSQEMPHSLEFVYLPLKEALPQAGVYTLTDSLEPRLNAAAARGNHLIVRFYLDYPGIESGMPDWLLKETGCTPYTEHGGGCSPDYSSPLLQNTLLDFIAEWGSAYDADPRLGFIQVGLLGYWGEWHNYPNTESFASEAFQQQVIESFDEAFDKTRIVIRSPVLDSPSRDFGFHDDSFAYSTLGEHNWFFLPELIAAGADEQWRRAPIGGELRPELQGSAFSPEYVLGEFSQEPMDCIHQTHVSWLLNYQAFHKEGSGYQGTQLKEAQSAAMAMGYELSIDAISITAGQLNPEAQTLSVSIAVTLTGSGVAPFYYPLSLIMEVGDERIMLGDDLETIQPGDHRVFTAELERATSTINDTYRLMLSTPMLLSEQRVRFAAAEDENGILTWSPTFDCQTDTGQVPVGSIKEGCICDVDGVFRDATWSECHGVEP